MVQGNLMSFRNMLTIAGKEVQMSFVTPIAYVIIAGFMFLSGFFFFICLEQYNGYVQQAALTSETPANLNEWVVLPFYQTLEVILVFLVPIMTMRAIAEEKRNGTFELLITSPVSVNDLILGKFFGFAVVMSVMLLCSFAFPLGLMVFADPENLPIIIGFLGILLFTLSLVPLGIAVSAFTKNQTVAGVVGVVLSLLLFIVNAPAQKMTDAWAKILDYLAPLTHIEPMLRGVIEGGDLVYFISLILIGLFVANRALEVERWR